MHDFRFLFQEPDALVGLPQLRGVIGHDAGFHAVFFVAIFIQRCRAAGETPKSLAIWVMDASPLRATATTSRQNSSGKALGMMNILPPARIKSSQAKCQSNLQQSPASRLPIALLVAPLLASTTQ